MNLNNNNKTNNKNNNNNNNNNNNSSDSFPTICQLLKYYSEILKKLSLFECKQCIELLNQLPPSHYTSNFTYTTLGRCYFEIGNYRKCSKYFEQSISLNPSYLSGLEYYSSCLYQLKDQFQCCTLANKCIEQSQFAPETWIVLGNCFSLQKEHEIAIKFFNRATQINPNFAYAYTLAGHEYVENENYNLANQCYTTALNYDQRHFNAWWGLGNIHLKEQNFSEAIKYFRKALSINNKSAVLHFYLAKAYLQGRDISKALKYLKKAQEEDEKNPMVKYQIALIYLNKGKYDDAITILKELDVKMPKEAPIHIALGDCYKFKHDYQKALEQYNFAIDLDPKDSNSAKSSIERLYADAGNENISLNNNK
jgi:anaphase-promoting complex subunit 3